MASVSNGGNEQVCLVSDLAPRRRDRIGAWRKRSGQCAQLFGVESNRKSRNQIDQLSADDPFARLTVGDKSLNILMSGRGGVDLDSLERKRCYVARLDEFGAQLVIARQAGGLQQFIYIGRIVLGIEIERVPRFIGRRAAFEIQREMDGLFVGARGV